jgi:hypothetical protein
MANIYEEKTEGLHQLLERARHEDGATVLIPDLQRPYVWTPGQVTLLVDSLFRGWPFGTLLMWKIGDGELQNIPHRQFWQVVDRTNESEGSAVARRDPPASYHMVLDGQQRVQSLLLALGGDGWGFKLEDRAWAQELQDRRPRGRQGKYHHWSKASLCFDLESFAQDYVKGGNLLAVDFRNVLRWTITDPAGGQSKWPKPDNYEEPLTRAFDQANAGRFIRLSRLWSATTPNPNIKEAQFQNIAAELFQAEGVAEDRITALLKPIGELMTTLRDVKLSKVTYLELLPYDRYVWDEDSYNDAIVNIFTRLNTAGRTLTREEITLAWLKVGWDSGATGGLGAGECFEKLLADLAARKVSIDMDDLVGAVSFIWSVCYNDGQILANRDLLRGATIRPMASKLAQRWNEIRRAVVEGADIVSDRGLDYGAGGHYSSVNALAILWAWLYLAVQWENKRGLTALQRDAFSKSYEATLQDVVDRWLLCSQWAGRWAGGSTPTVFAGYAKGLAASFESLETCTNQAEAMRILEERAEDLVRNLEVDASAYVNGLAVASRERVAQYRNLLWIWHRLESGRWAKSRIPLRSGKSTRPALEVDHAVAYALWKTRLSAGSIELDASEAEGLVNSIGNCSLLEKTFNISKSDKTLRSFLEQVHEFRTGQEQLNAWASALSLDEAMMSPDAATFGAIADAIQARERAIRADIIDFIKGQKHRADLASS